MVIIRAAKRKASASFFEKKGAPPGEAKKLRSEPVTLAPARPTAPRSKSFLVLFFKKEHYCLLS
jgi:hypothetical protein